MKKVILTLFILLLLVDTNAQQKAAINWPQKYEQSKSKFHVQNEIEINASSEKVWQILIDAKNW